MSTDDSFPRPEGSSGAHAAHDAPTQQRPVAPSDDQPTAAYGHPQADAGYSSHPAGHEGYGSAYSQQEYGQQQYGSDQTAQQGQYGQPQYGEAQQQYGYGQHQSTPQGQYGHAPGGYGYDQSQGQYGYAQPAMPQAIPFAGYGSRVGAYLLDTLLSFVPLIVLSGIGAWLAFKDSYEVRDPFDDTSHLEGINGSGILLMVVGFLVAVLFQLWNRGVRQGKTGQSLGKKMMHIKVVDERTGQPAGVGMGFGRYAVEVGFGIVNSCVGVLTLLDLLWPLWDDKKQALHDKIVHTVVLKGD